MNALISLDAKQLAISQSIDRSLELPKPFAQDLFLTAFAVTGNVFGLPEWALTLKIGDRLKLFRDTKNRFDKNSIVIKDDAGNRIGFVPMNKNEILARLLEGGKALYAKVSKCFADESDFEICVEIYMEA